tara:strand:+ start:5987 stop:6370 length:384 start_codon:yes stop_codon:yes gene_type:complete
MTFSKTVISLEENNMEFKKVILCAANKFNVYKDGVFLRELVIADSGHFLTNMQDVMDLLEDSGHVLEPVKDSSWGQGFLGCVGDYYTREEAYHIAIDSGQPLNQSYAYHSSKELDSSCLRHLPLHVS